MTLRERIDDGLFHFLNPNYEKFQNYSLHERMQMKPRLWLASIVFCLMLFGGGSAIVAACGPFFLPLIGQLPAMLLAMIATMPWNLLSVHVGERLVWRHIPHKPNASPPYSPKESTMSTTCNPYAPPGVTIVDPYFPRITTRSTSNTSRDNLPAPSHRRITRQ